MTTEYHFTEDDVKLLHKLHDLYLFGSVEEGSKILFNFFEDEEDTTRKEAIDHVLSHHPHTWVLVTAKDKYYCNLPE
jgi:hypothetical protein